MTIPWDNVDEATLAQPDTMASQGIIALTLTLDR